MKKLTQFFKKQKGKGGNWLIKQALFGAVCMLLGAICGLRIFSIILIPSLFLLLGYYLGNKTKEDTTNTQPQNTNVPKKPTPSPVKKQTPKQ